MFHKAIDWIHTYGLSTVRKFWLVRKCPCDDHRSSLVQKQSKSHPKWSKRARPVGHGWYKHSQNFTLNGHKSGRSSLVQKQSKFHPKWSMRARPVGHGWYKNPPFSPFMSTFLYSNAVNYKISHKWNRHVCADFNRQISLEICILDIFLCMSHVDKATCCAYLYIPGFIPSQRFQYASSSVLGW